MSERIIVDNVAAPAAVEEAVLFPFDDASLPFSRNLLLNLVMARKFPDEIDGGNNIVMDPSHPGGTVLPQGGPGAPDSYEVICPTVYYIDGEYRMWYLAQGEDHRRRTCYAVSRDGLHWERPALGLVEYNGNTRNNLIPGPAKEWILYDPEDPDPGRRFKAAAMQAEMRIGVHFSADGLHWTPSPHNPVLPGMEPGGLFRFHGCYYINGQGGPSPINRPLPHPIPGASKRHVITYASYDFEHWTRSAALTFRRDALPPRLPSDLEAHRGEQVHEGAAVWNRGNVLLGLYGQYHNTTNDRRDSSCDIGFVISHDALHFKEPLPDFKMIHSYEERDGAEPRLIQRQAFAQIGERTVYWYSVWREHPGTPTGVRVATWERDRLGYYAPASPDRGLGALYEPHCISCPLRVSGAGVRVYLNADGLGPYSALRVEILDEQFRPLPGYAGEDCLPQRESGLRQPVAWRGHEALGSFPHPLRIRVNWEGIRPEDARLYAVYVA